MAKQLKKILKHFFLINDSPHKIAAGASLGLFLGIIPGAGILAALALSSLLRLNRLAASTTALAVNSWSSLVILPLAAMLGGFMFNIDPQVLINDFRTNYNLGWRTFLEETVFFNLLLPLIIGFFITAGILSIAFYFFLYFLLRYKKIKFK